MARKSRTTNKRILEEDAGTNEPRSSPGSLSKRARTYAASRTPKGLTEHRCHLLKLAPELRNRIYDFAEEDLSTSPYAPGVKLLRQPLTGAGWAKRPWQYYALTQACQLLRTEFYPLWMRKLAVRLYPGTVPDFIATFLPTTAPDTVGPKLIQLLWSHPRDMVSSDLADITPLLRARARFPGLLFEYVPVNVAEIETVKRTDPRDSCYCDERDAEEWDEYECTCDSDEQTVYFDDYMQEEEESMAYIETLQEFLTNNDKYWLKDIHAGRISVNCTFDRVTELPLFRIRYRAAPKGKTYHHSATCALLEHWGILKLSQEARMEFVVAFVTEEEDQTGESLSTTSKVREVRVARPQ